MGSKQIKMLKKNRWVQQEPVKRTFKMSEFGQKNLKKQ